MRLKDALSFERWDTYDHELQIAVARRVEAALAPRLRLMKLEAYRLGNTAHTIAIFSSDAGQFALLPGYRGYLGYDAAHLEDTRFSRAALFEAIGPHHSQPERVQTYLARVLTPLRRVELAPFAISVATEPKEHVEYIPGVAKHYVRRVTQQDVAESVAKEGYRLPSDDEWEYACSGGGRSFFRWGDIWPPLYWSPAESRLAEEWREDLEPNAFGLRIGQDPYEIEYCSEAGMLRGGDGGTSDTVAVCLEDVWLPLATCYRFPFTSFDTSSVLTAYIRRALSLPTALLDETVP